MASSSGSIRTVQESEQFRLEKDRITFGERDADELLQMAVYWPLANEPTRGRSTPEPGVWGFVFEPAPELQYVVYYEFNDEVVILLSIQPADKDYRNLYS
jgi:hypothetical protein